MSERTYTELRALADTFTESEGHLLYTALCSRFGWAGILCSREDVEDVFYTYTEDEEGLTDEMWAKVQDDYGWRHMSDMLGESSHTTIRLIVEDLIK